MFKMAANCFAKSAGSSVRIAAEGEVGDGGEGGRTRGRGKRRTAQKKKPKQNRDFNVALLHNTRAVLNLNTAELRHDVNSHTCRCMINTHSIHHKLLEISQQNGELQNQMTNALVAAKMANDQKNLKLQHHHQNKNKRNTLREKITIDPPASFCIRELRRSSSASLLSSAIFIIIKLSFCCFLLLLYKSGMTEEKKSEFN